MRQKKFAYLGKSFTRFLLLVILATIVVVVQKCIDYRYVVVQKMVQEGQVKANWQEYMQLTGMVVLVSLILTIIKIFFTMWVEKVQKVNFFKVYNGLIQEDGKFQGSQKDLVVAIAKVTCVIDGVETVINSIYIILLMGVVTMSVPEYIGAVAILIAGVTLGVVRGKLQAKTDMLWAETQTLQQKLSHFFMISSTVLDERLEEIQSNYWRRILLQGLKNAIQVLPNVVKVMAFVALFYNIIMTGMAEGEIYPYTIVVLTAYGYIVNLAENISSLIESGSKIVLYNKDPELQAIRAELEKRQEEIRHNYRVVQQSAEGFKIPESFKLSLIRPNGEEAFYKIPECLTLIPGAMVRLEGENGTGKSRFAKHLAHIGSQAKAYDTKTAIVEQYCENLKRGKSNIDFNLIKYLANGLQLERVPRSEKEFMELKCSSINSADRQMLIALQILYFAIKESKERIMQFIILDEIFANLSLERTQKVLPFMVSELAKIGACTIIVSHTHKEEVDKYTSATWKMYNEGDEVIIEEMKKTQYIA